MPNIDSTTSLAFSMHANRGSFALLLGSGVSHGAGIPTGWTILNQLIRCLPDFPTDESKTDPFLWFKNKFGRDASYTDLLKTLFPKPIERRGCLARFIEPSKEDEEKGLKKPTVAHRSIARMMKEEFVRIVVTTNFDGLLEQALAEENVTADVIYNPNHVLGSRPLSHPRPIIIKVHGDYRDSRILNTEDELNRYSPPMKSLLKRVFNEFGVVVCGWSATWDTALRDIIETSNSRIFSWYWAQKGDLSQEARQVIHRRDAKLIEIDAAEEFFPELWRRIETIENFQQRHPMSVGVLMGTAKRFFEDPAPYIRLHDLFMQVLQEVSVKCAEMPIVGLAACNKEAVAERIKHYDSITDAIVALTVTIGRWSNDISDKWLAEAISQIAIDRVPPSLPHDETWKNLSFYPARLVFFAGGMMSLLANRPELTFSLMTAPTTFCDDRQVPAVLRLGPLPNVDSNLLDGLYDGPRSLTALNDWTHDRLRAVFRPYLFNDDDYDLLFDTFEFYIFMAFKALFGDFEELKSARDRWDGNGQRLDTILASFRSNHQRFGGRALGVSLFKSFGPRISLDAAATTARDYIEKNLGAGWELKPGETIRITAKVLKGDAS